MSDVFRVHDCAQQVEDKADAEQDDRVYPDDLGDDLQACELVLESLEEVTDDRCALRDQEPG